MRVLSGPWAGWPVQEAGTSLTVGVLDGVHLGHRHLLERVVALPGVPCVVTFDAHPVEVLAPGTDPRLIIDLHERVALFASLGIELVAVVDLHEVRYLDPAVFVDEILVGKLRLRSMVTGADFQFGRDRAGNVALIEAMAPTSGFDVDVVELVASGGVIS